MAHVTVTLNGRKYRMACEDGEEDRLRALCADLDRRMLELRTRVGEVGDTRLTVMAALTIADELGETAGRIARLEDELRTVKNARLAVADRSQATQAAIAEAFNAAAARIEALSRNLNDTLRDEVAMG